MGNILKSTFGSKFNIWDVILIFLLVAYPIYVITQEGVEGIFTEIASYIYAAIIISWIGNKIVSRAKK